MDYLSTIRLSQISKRYTAHWILKNVDYTFSRGNSYGIKGANGSGKSTLLKMISGYLSTSAGSIIYESEKKVLSRDDIYQHVSIWGPYVGLMRELRIDEMVDHFYVNKELPSLMSMEDWYARANIPVKRNALISSLSSGQEQRLGLALAIMNTTGLLLLDEPSSYLDEASKKWLYQLIKDYSQDRIILIASNDAEDLQGCKHLIDITAYK